MRLLRSRTLAAAAAILVALTGCREAPGGTVLGVTITPTAVTLPIGEMQTFTANVTATGTIDTSVTWTATCGTITGSGHTITYTAPTTAGTCTLTAASAADASHSATANVTVVAPSTASVSVTPTAVTLPPGGAHTFTATVTGTSDTSVTWTTTCGSIIASGNMATYTAPMTEGTCAIIATSVADPTAAEDAVITIQATPAGTVTVTPSAATLEPGESQPFNATVTGHADVSVTWTTTCGTLTGTSNTITYTAPATEGTCTLTATSNADPTESASATITIAAPSTVSVSLSPTAVTLAPSDSQSFTATVTGTTDTGVTWATTCGTVSGSGNTITYTAPATPSTCSLTATSVADPGESASATITVTEPDEISVTVTPANATLRIGRTQLFTSAVTGTTNTAVTWTATGGSYTGVTAVVYTAPDVLGDYVLTATSVADPSQSASAAIRVVAHPDELWARQYGTSDHDTADDVAVDADGNVFVAGSTAGALFVPLAGETDGFLLKLDEDGSVLWMRDVGIALADTGFDAVAVGPAGNVVVAGATDGNLGGPDSHAGGLDVLVAKYAANGDLVWLLQTGTAATEGATSVAVDLAGNVFVAGYTLGDFGGPRTHQGSYDAFLMKLDENGNHLWTRQPGTTAEDWAHGVDVGVAGNVVVVGHTYGSLFHANQGSGDAFALKMSAAGDFSWAAQFGTPESDSANGVAIDLLGNVIVAGSTSGSLPGPGLHQGGNDAYVAAFDADGKPLWARQYGTSADDALAAVKVGLAGNVIAAGSTYGAFAEPNPNDACDALVIKLDGYGMPLWSRQFGTGVWWNLHTTQARGVAVGPAGNVLVVGLTGGSLAGPHQGWHDAFVIKLAP
jgi:hypothetical protein